MRVSDYIAKFLADQGVDMVFTITGSGNVRLIEAIHQAGIRYICPHHEQAAVMAALTRLRISGKPAVCLVTGGPGAANTLIAVADAHLDSIPCILIAGQEKLEFVEPANPMRGKGVQGLNMVDIMSSVTKFATCLKRAIDVRSILEQAFYEAYSGRPGPVWIDVPQDLQWVQVEEESLLAYKTPESDKLLYADMQQAAATTLALIKTAKRPLLWVGHGIRLSRCEEAFRRVFNALGVPALVSWQAADLVPDEHPLYVGRAGTYGQRWANLALQNCDLLITLGTRLALPQRGYVDSEFARAAKKVIVEIDPVEMAKFTFPIDVPALGDVRDFITQLELQLPTRSMDEQPMFQFEDWRNKCWEWRARYPMSLQPAPEDTNTNTNTNAGINSYWFVERLSDHLAADDIVVTDMGTSLTCTHATIRIKDGQRLVTSTGLGEMGFGLPGSIGAALGAPGRRIVLIAGEGSLMMNLQELQTIQHLQLPIKIFLLNNNGYLTIKHTHNALFSSMGSASATSPNTGVSFPDFSKIAPAFGMEFHRIESNEGLDFWIQRVLSTSGSVLAEVMMPEFQELIPKSSLKLRPDGSLYSPPLEDLYPFLTPDRLAQEMIIPLLST
jgi:acetolactate synthase-1/2/3 large subunit